MKVLTDHVIYFVFFFLCVLYVIYNSGLYRKVFIKVKKLFFLKLKSSLYFVSYYTEHFEHLHFEIQHFNGITRFY